MKYSGIVYEMEKNLAFRAVLEGLELEVHVDSDISYNEEKDIERIWESRSEAVKAVIKEGSLDFLKGSEGIILVCVLLYTVRHGMYILSRRGSEIKIE